MSERRPLLAAALVLAAACADAAPEREAPVGADSPAAAAAAPPPPVEVDTAAPGDPREAPLQATVRRSAGRAFHVTGLTRAAGALEMTLEDGHRVLYGPTTVPVEDGRFELDFVADPSDQPHFSLFVTTPDGARQWVVPIPSDSMQVSFGPSL